MPRKKLAKFVDVDTQEPPKVEITPPPEEKPAPDEKTDDKALFSQEGELVVDVFETDKNFVVLTAIAGVQIKDLDIAVEKDMMVIKGSRTDPHAHPEKKYFYQECYWGPFSKKVVLPENIDTKSANAQIDKGILTITIPKLES